MDLFVKLCTPFYICIGVLIRGSATSQQQISVKSIMAPGRDRLICDPSYGYCFQRLHDGYLRAGDWDHLLSIDVSPPKITPLTSPCAPSQLYPDIINKTCSQLTSLTGTANQMIGKMYNQFDDFFSSVRRMTNQNSDGVGMLLKKHLPIKGTNRSKRSSTDFFGDVANFFGVASTKQIRQTKKAISALTGMAKHNREGLMALTQAFSSYQSSIKKEFDVRDQTLNKVINSTSEMFRAVGHDLINMKDRLKLQNDHITANTISIHLLGSAFPLILQVIGQLTESLQWYSSVLGGFTTLLGGTLDPILFPHHKASEMMIFIRKSLQNINPNLDLEISPDDLSSVYQHIRCIPFVYGNILMVKMKIGVIDKTAFHLTVWKLESFGVPIHAREMDEKLMIEFRTMQFSLKQLMVALDLPYTHIAISSQTSQVITYTTDKIILTRYVGNRVILPSAPLRSANSVSKCLKCLLLPCPTQFLRRLCPIKIRLHWSTFLVATGPNAWLVHTETEPLYTFCGKVLKLIPDTHSDVIITVPCGCYLRVGTTVSTPIAISSCPVRNEFKISHVIPKLILTGDNMSKTAEIWSALRQKHPELDLRTSSLAVKTEELLAQAINDQNQRVKGIREDQQDEWLQQMKIINQSISASAQYELDTLLFLKSVHVKRLLPAMAAVVLVCLVGLGGLTFVVLKMHLKNQRYISSSYIRSSTDVMA